MAQLSKAAKRPQKYKDEGVKPHFRESERSEDGLLWPLTLFTQQSFLFCLFLSTEGQKASLVKM